MFYVKRCGIAITSDVSDVLVQPFGCVQQKQYNNTKVYLHFIMAISLGFELSFIVTPSPTLGK